jgi:hypothetical protein
MKKLTKKQEAEAHLAKLELEAKLGKALSWPVDVAPDVPPPEGAGASGGWRFNTNSRKVALFWSESNAHGPREARDHWSSRTQGPIWLFSTRVKALQALRYALARQYAESLLRLSENIEEELASGRRD